MAVTAILPIARVLIADDEDAQRNGLASMVRAWGFAADTAADGQEALEKLLADPASVLITDLKMPRMDGFELLRRLPAENINIPAIVLTAFGNIETAVSTMHELGAFWFLEKPIQPSVLRVLLDRAIAHARLAEETQRLQRQLSQSGSMGQMAGQSPVMRRAFALIEQVAPSKAAVLITGESGTGKELVARALHALSPRRAGPFVALNCAAMPESLIESELFGHEKGAFTGAVERRAGCFELAQQGTLLLDEIGDMPVNTQAKLLRVLEDSRVRRLGGKTEMLVDVRVVASTNKNLAEAIRKGQFREDLYYRLNVFEMQLPPLRERMDDIPVLCGALLEELNRKHATQVAEIAAEALDLLKRHQWPGNVRELRNALERAVILAGEGAIQPRHLPPALLPAAPQPDAPPAPVNDDFVLIRPGTTIDDAERALILRTVQLTKGNKTRAAEILGITLKTLMNKLNRYEEASQQGL
ncbi:MAG: sigma-54-dependent Fis family transcriptional regulator [Acidobacteria bacterium]|nr:sigma-54-dependent Fis family transcriptional regulator [Acidobacteriota bacterium]